MTDPKQMTTDPYRAHQLERIADNLEDINRSMRRLVLAVDGQR